MRALALIAIGAMAIGPLAPEAFPDTAITIAHSRAELESKWAARIHEVLATGRIPLVDLESSLPHGHAERYLDETLGAMDDAGVALIAFDGFQAPKTDASPKGYRWGYAVHALVKRHPSHFILATNGGTNPNWAEGKDSFITQTEAQARSGQYPIMGEYEFRHYMSGYQCRNNRFARDVDVPLDSPNGHRLFKLSEETGIAFVIHNDPEDHALTGLETMLKTYPRAKVINAHFGQVRHPERQARYTPALIRRLLTDYPNLHFDLATGGPGRTYKCGGFGDPVLDVMFWQDEGIGQKGTLKPEFLAILADFKTRFVVGLDYGSGRPPLPDYIRRKAANIRLILRDLPEAAQHDIGYRNAWRLLTGRPWQ